MEERIFGISLYGCAVIAAGILSSLICGTIGVSSPVNAGVSAVLAIAFSALVGLYRKKTSKERAQTGTIIRPEYVAEAAIAVTVVLIQIVAVMRLRFENPAATASVESATKVFESGSCIFADPMMVLIGTVSRLVSVHPLSLIYYLAPVFILFYYVCAFGLICTITRGRARFTAFITLTVLNAWGYQSERLIPLTLLITWFGTGVFVIHGLLVVTAGVLIRYVKDLPVHDKTAADNGNEEDLEERDMKNHKIINARNLAIALGVLAVLLIGAVAVLNSKINRLYAATVNLQDDMNRRCSMYEFAPEGKTAQGYLLQGSDGLITFVGGGSAENAEELSDFLAKYGSVVNTWYIYGDDDENAGAMKKLLSSGEVTADNVYVITREEITGQW